MRRRGPRRRKEDVRRLGGACTALSAARGASIWLLKAVASSFSSAMEDRLTVHVSEAQHMSAEENRKRSLDSVPSACLCLATKSYVVGREFPS